MRASDERRFGVLSVQIGKAGRDVVDEAIATWQALHGDNRSIDAGVRGEGLRAICAEWRAEIEAIRG